eukprot:scaffold1117_cov167-Amphora_coffeaeformis.AAC.15
MGSNVVVKPSCRRPTYSVESRGRLQDPVDPSPRRFLLDFPLCGVRTGVPYPLPRPAGEGKALPPRDADAPRLSSSLRKLDYARRRVWFALRSPAISLLSCAMRRWISS